MWRKQVSCGNQEYTFIQADDQPEICNDFVEIGLEMGITIFSFKNGLGIVEFLLKNNEINGLILDNHMPFVTGLEILRELRQNGWNIPIIIFSGAKSIQKEVEDLGATFIMKGFTRKDLEDVVKKMVGLVEKYQYERRLHNQKKA